MGWRKWVYATLCCGILVCTSLKFAHAFYVDPKKKTMELTGKLQSRVTIRLQDSEGFTQPIDIGVGDLVQWRNLALIEVNHDLKRLTKQLDILSPLKALKIDMKYRLVGRFLYEGVYDVGPQAFQDVKDNDKENITNFSQQYDLWEAYFDLSRGPVFLRIGRQNLAWGETDSFRLLDAINPLDNTFGGPFEDVDDRRIPVVDVAGQLQFRQGRACFSPDPGRLLGARQLGRSRFPAGPVRDRVFASLAAPAGAVAAATRLSGKEHVEQPLGGAPDGHALGDEPFGGPLQDLHGPAEPGLCNRARPSAHRKPLSGVAL